MRCDKKERKSTMAKEREKNSTKGKEKAHPWDALQQKQRKIAMAMGREGESVEGKCVHPRNMFEKESESFNTWEK
jgi:hypothetical protein